ncbi:MAG: hypothetical protein ACUVUS_00730 [Thermoproteota archaeon]
MSQELPLPPPPRKPSRWRSVAIVLFVLGIVLGSIIGYTANYQQIESLQVKIQDLQYDRKNLQSKNHDLQSSLYQLQTDYNELRTKYQQLQEKYRYAATVPYTIIWNGSITWYFNDLAGKTLAWTMPIDTYRSYANRPKTEDYVRLNLHGATIKVLDIRNYIQPNFFSKVIYMLTEGRSDKDFVREVDNVKNQIVVYGSGLGDFYRWPAETLTECRGMCGDIAIFMASMIIKGNEQENYGMKIYVWYVDADNIEDPQSVNHAVVGVEFKDGTEWIIETTTNYFYNYLTEYSVSGWKFDVTYQGLED